MLFQNLNFNIAIAYLRLKKFEGIITLFSLIGVVLGVATLVVVTSVMNGFYDELQKHVLGINGHIEIANISGKHNDIIPELTNDFSEIRYIIPSIQRESLISTQYNTLAIMAKGISFESLSKQDTITSKIIHGDIKNFEEGIIIGNQIATLLDVEVGDEVKIIVPELTNTVIGQIPRIKTYKIVAIFSFGMYEYDSTIVYIPFKSASKVYRTLNPNLFEIYLKNENNTQKLMKELKKVISLPMYSWQEKQSSYFNALKTERSVMFIILSLIIIVASFNIISTLVMLVEDKKKSIAILRTMGVSEFDIINIFVICGTIIGIIGTSVGILLGLLFTFYINNIKIFLEKLTGSVLFEPTIYFFNEIPTIILYSDVFKIILLSLISAFIATIIPAQKAAKTSPSEILRHE